MPLSWNEIKSRAIAFSREWAKETREDAEAKSFWDAFFNVFGISRRMVATFEEPVRSLKDTYKFIDLFWKGILLVEHKSAGKDLEEAKGQAFDYVQDLIREGRNTESPRYIIVSNFSRIHLYDLEAADRLVADFTLKDLHSHVKHFAFIAGYKQLSFVEEPTVNLKAAGLMDDIYDTLRDTGYPNHQRQVFLVRLLFCLFANDTGIFDSKVFDLLVEESAPDGKDLGSALSEFFDTLNIPREKRQTTLDETLAGLPYVNGGLFAESLPVAHFNTAMRKALLEATRFDWSRISPAVFGSLFQGVMDAPARRRIGAHYTSEANILKVIRPLFLDGLQDELKKAGTNNAALNRLHDKLADIKFLDPACGCGNFLVIAYREIRKIENELLATLYEGQTIFDFDLAKFARVNVDQFHGIEIDEWPARIAEVAMWLMDHQMNLDLSVKLGKPLVRLPLTKTADIHQANALSIDWAQVLPPAQCPYVMGNPPFIGSRMMNKDQKAEVRELFHATKTSGDLDYVTCWYLKAAQYIKGTKIECAFVSTNSISQGLQVGILWEALAPYNLFINFAHRTFAWQSEARGKAHVHVVILGFSNVERPNKLLFDYEDIQGEPLTLSVKTISPYLLEAPFIFVTRQQTPLCPVPEMIFGNMPADGGFLLFTDEEKTEFLKQEPKAVKFIRRIIGSQEFLHNISRWCLWLVDASPVELKALPAVFKRIAEVKTVREQSARPHLANIPSLFAQITQPPDVPYIVVPGVSSERRKYVPIGYMLPEVIASNLVNIVPNGTLYHFGVLTSAMHMAWMRQVAGRLKSDYRYSKDIVYNTFPWPEKVSDERRAEIERCAQTVLDERATHMEKGATLADLYDPVAMPPGLAKAHAALDRAVDRAYRSAPFISERARVEHLFGLYQALTTLFPEKPKKRTRKNAVTPATSSE